MDRTTLARALFNSHPRRKNKALLLDIILVSFCTSSNLENVARHAEKHFIDAVERKKSKNRGSFRATYSLLPLAMLTCGEADSDVHALIKELAIRRVEQGSEIHSNEFRYLAERTRVARLRRRFSFVLQQAISFGTRYLLCRYGVALAGTQQLRSQGPVPVHAHCADGRTGSEGREKANRDGHGDGNGDGDGNGSGSGGRDERTNARRNVGRRGGDTREGAKTRAGT